MNSKAKKHENIMSFLEMYFQENSKEVIDRDIKEISNMNFSGTTATEYFLNFDKYYFSENFQEIDSNLLEKNDSVIHFSENVKLSSIALRGLLVTSHVKIVKISTDNQFINSTVKLPKIYHSTQQNKYSDV